MYVIFISLSLSREEPALTGVSDEQKQQHSDVDVKKFEDVKQFGMGEELETQYHRPKEGQRTSMR